MDQPVRLSPPSLSFAARMFALLLVALVALDGCAPARRETGPALWRIADADSEIWLFGSVHLLPPELVWRTERIDAAFAAADEIVFETDASEQGGEDLRRIAAELGRLPAGGRLSALLDPAGREQLARVARAHGLEPDALEPLRPWLAALTLSLSAAIKQGHRQEAGVEAVLLDQAGAKKVSYLETPEQQIRTLADLGAADELRFLIVTLRQIEEAPGGPAALDEAWAEGDVARLDALVREEISEAGPAVYEALIARRNARWAEEIARRLDGEGRIFVAVGAAHLSGEDGLVALLRARGVVVEGP